MTKKSKTKKFSSDAIFGSEVMGHGFTALPNILVRGQARLGLSTTQFNLLAQLLSYWIDPERPPFPSKRDLAKRIGLNPTTVRINMAKLEEKGLIRREQQTTSAGDYGSNIYHMDGLIDALKALVPDFDQERADRKARRALVERRGEKDEADERARRRGVVRRR